MMAELSEQLNLTNEDPVAQFLAQEQSVLGNLDDDLAFSETHVNNDEAILNDSDSKGFNGDFNSLDQPNGEIDDIGLSNGVSDLSLNARNDQGSMGSGSQGSFPMLSQPIIPAEEPESIKKWREQHKKNLETKDIEEKTKIEDLRKEGKKELDEWYARYDEQLEKTKKQNRAAEKEFISERDNEQSGQEWEKINRLCDFNPKTCRNTRDTSRMRSILLQLKQSPPQNSAKVST